MKPALPTHDEPYETSCTYPEVEPTVVCSRRHPATTRWYPHESTANRKQAECVVLRLIILGIFAGLYPRCSPLLTIGITGSVLESTCPDSIDRRGQQGFWRFDHECVIDH